MRGVRHPATRLRGRNNENKRRRWNRWNAERIRGGAHENLRCDGSARFFLVIEDGTRTTRPYRVVIIVTGKMRMKRLAVMMLGLIGVEMHVQKWRADRACLHQQDEGRGGQPAKHKGIVVKDERPGT